MPTRPARSAPPRIRGCPARVLWQCAAASRSSSGRSAATTSASAWAPAGASITTRSVPSGIDRHALRCRLEPSIGSTALSMPERRSAQRVDDPCGSASTRTVLRPARADSAARWVAIVVLPTPPLELATSTAFIHCLRHGNEPRAYTGGVTGAKRRRARTPGFYGIFTPRRPCRACPGPGRHGTAGACYRRRLPRLPRPRSSMSDLQDLVALIRADTPLIVVEIPDEMRVVELFRQSLTRIWRARYRWSITEGLRRLDLDREDPAHGPPDALATLAAIRDADQRGVYLLLDFHPYLGYAATRRQLREILQRRGCLPHTIVLVGHRVELPGELEARAA